VADPRQQALEELLGWWVEQGGEPGDARGIADWLWLHASLNGRQLPRRFLPAGGLPEAPVVAQVAPEPPQPQPLAPNDVEPPTPEPGALDRHAPTVFPPAPAPTADPAEAGARLLSPAFLPDDEAVREQLRRRKGAVPLLLSQQPLLRRPLPLLMALRPLLQKQPHPRWRVLEEERTAERSAELGRPWPAFRPCQVPAVEVCLWLDAGVAMAVWWPLAQELRHLLASSQAFARVELHRFALEQLAGAATDARRGRQGSDGTTVNLVLSDTAGRHWWDGSMDAWLAELARDQPLAILHTLPIRYQGRTALRRGEPVTLSNSQGLGPNSGYRAEPLANLDPRRVANASAAPLLEGLKLPVLALDPRDLAPWAALVMGDALARGGGTVLPLADGAEPLPLPATAVRPESQLSPADAEALWLAFCQQASPDAQRLMRLLAAAPLLTLPVLRLLLAAELPELLAPLPLAEVLVSGLVRRRDGDPEANPDRVQFELLPAIQALLEARLEPRRRVEVIQSITDLLERHWNQQGRGPSFQTLLTDPRTPLPEEAEGLAHFANVTAAMLDRLPGQPFRDLARDLRAGTGSLPPSPWPAAVAFNEEMVDTARLVEVPQLESLTVATARFEPQPLLPLPFESARLERIPRQDQTPSKVRARREPKGPFVVHRFRAEAWGFREPLQGDGLSLTLVEIPAGEFRMGCAEGEEGYSDEKPQHLVRLPGFFLGQTPITQAQWREVAQWKEREGERWGRELNPSPSCFQATGKGDARLLEGEASTDQRPVERVSWHEAMEFCDRLSQRTGRAYTLPSEAQWEYACRAGTKTPFAFGETLTAELANYDANATYGNGSKGKYREQTTPVGMFPANAWGLQDMHGNVWEWCLDDWHGSYEGAPEDGSAWRIDETGPDRGKEEGRRRKGRESGGEGRETEAGARLLRGGSWVNLPRFCRSAYRVRYHPGGRYGNCGFRVCCLPQDPSLNT
jgi:formylglycine-generating enzyme required for sulfatase activity